MTTRTRFGILSLLLPFCAAFGCSDKSTQAKESSTNITYEYLPHPDTSDTKTISVKRNPGSKGMVTPAFSIRVPTYSKIDPTRPSLAGGVEGSLRLSYDGGFVDVLFRETKSTQADFENGNVDKLLSALLSRKEHNGKAIKTDDYIGNIFDYPPSAKQIASSKTKPVLATRLYSLIRPGRELTIVAKWKSGDPLAEARVVSSANLIAWTLKEQR